MTDTDRIKNVEIHEVMQFVRLIKSVAEVVKEMGRVPESSVFLACQAKGIGLGGYERIRDTLVNTKLVKIVHHEYVWIVPDPTPVPSPSAN